ncbi:MAG: carbamoyltransferase C-terminal domain-containing protein [Candidatus Omnitrophica bacterium]|nr:carbamoyltransferase C-terminal domain-containing protein [Candidatus Omnitrophota bacterium]
MNIAGLSYFMHDSSVSLLNNGVPVFSAAEERFNEEKRSWAYPSRALEACLNYSSFGLRDIDCFCLNFDPGMLFRKRSLLGNAAFFPKSYRAFYDDMLLSLFSYLKIARLRVGLRPRKLVYIEHHNCHAAASFFTSPFEDSAILVLDGFGEYATGLLAFGNGPHIKTINKILYPHSIGLLYLSITTFLGFDFYGEGKVMALAAYGRPEYYDIFKKMIHLVPGGRFKLDLSYFDFHLNGFYNFFSSKFYHEMGLPRSEGEPVEERHKNIASSLQKRLTDVLMHAASYLKEKSRSENLVLGGGVALNCVANGELQASGIFKNIFVPASPDDGGSSLGAALYFWHCLLGKSRKSLHPTVYLGPEIADTEAERILSGGRFDFKKDPEIEKTVAGLLAKGNVIAWCQGRMEFSPRALGNRSILADPRVPGMKDRLNRQVKFREDFRPFGAIVLNEHWSQFFSPPRSSDMMMAVYSVKEDKKRIIPSVVHVDGSTRLQIIDPENNPKICRVLNEFFRLTGVPLLINTSFNTRGKPIVNSVEQALRCFEGSFIDYLVLGDYLISKKDG